MNPGDLCKAQSWAPGYNFIITDDFMKDGSPILTRQITGDSIYMFLGMDSKEKLMGRFLLPDGTVWLSELSFVEVLP